MTSQRTLLFSLISIAATGFAFGQAAPAQYTTSPSSASSPSQRAATSTPAQEAPADNSGDPASAASPHQQQATGNSMAGKAKHDEMMKDCVAKEQAKDSAVTKDQAKKTCTDQMKKMSSDHSGY
jgi:hypothetical protein